MAKKYIDVDKLKAEIKQLKETNKPSIKRISDYIQGGIYGFDLAVEKILAIIDSLEQEQPQVADASKMEPEVGVENYIQSYLEAIGFGYGGWVDGLRDEDLKKIARHFYELGLNARKEE